MFDAIRQSVCDYYDQIPSNTWKTVGKSALFSFTASLLLQRNFTGVASDYSRPLMAMGLASLAAFIHALMTPVFNTIFGNQDQVKFHQECIKCMFEVCLIRLSIQYAMSHRVNAIAEMAFSFISVNFIKSLIHILPDVVSWIDSQEGSEVKTSLKNIGLDTPPGQNTTFIVF